MAAEQVVELEIVGRRMVVAVPPEPVAALSDENLFAGGGERGRVGRGRVERRPRFGELAPGPLVVGVPDPDVEVGVDPGAGKDRHELPRRHGAGLGHRHGPQFGVRRETAIEGAQKRAAAALEMFPGVLPVEDDRDERVLAARAIAVAPAGFHQPVHEIVGGRLGVPARIAEADEIGQGVIAEHGGDRGVPRPDAVRRVQPLRLLHLAAAVAGEGHVERARKNQLVGGEPLEAGGHRQRNHRVRYRAFRRPQTDGGRAEQALVVTGRACQLLGRILGVNEPLARHARIGMGAQVDVGVAQERQDRVVER